MKKIYQPNLILSRTKRIFTIVIAICTLFTAFIFPVKADDEDQMIFEANEDLYSILETSPGAFETSQLKNFKLRESDIPLYMQSTDIKNTDSVVRLKIMEKDLGSFTYLNSDGTLSTYMFSEDVKYKSGDKIFDKTNILNYDLNNKVYYNPDNDVHVSLPISLSEENVISVTNKNYCISFMPLLGESEVIANKCFKSEMENYIVYNNPFGEGTKLIYYPEFSGLKEDIVISNPIETNCFKFHIYTNGLRAVQCDNSVALVDKDESIIAYLDELIIFDSVENQGNGHVEIEEITPYNEYFYRIIVDYSFMNSTNTIYPITIDPGITYSTGTKMKDVQVNYNQTTVDQTSSFAVVGYNATYNASRLFVKFPSLSSFVDGLSPSSQIGEVTYNFYCSLTTSSNYEFYYFYPCTAYWDENSNSVSTTLFNSYNTTSSGVVIIDNIGSYSANLTSLFTTSISDIKNYGFVMKKFNENTYSAVIYTVNNTSNRPLLRIRYSEALPSTQTYGISDKSIYMIKNYEYLTYITKNATISGSSVNMSFALESINTQYGSTRNKSQLISLNYDGSGKYTLSFLMPPTTSDPTSTTTGYSTNYYFRANWSGNTGSLSCSTTLTAATKWYIAYDSSYSSYKIINARYPWLYLYASNNVLTLSELSSTVSRWIFSYCGRDVPLYMQGHPNSCGWACVCMILKYYSINVTEDEIIGNNDETSNYNLMAQSLNNYINTSPIYYGNYDLFYFENDEEGFLSTLISYLNYRPVSLLCRYSSSSQMGWETQGHYLVLKGIFNINNSYKCVINDSYQYSCNERIIDLDEIHEYNNSLYGYSVHP